MAKPPGLSALHAVVKRRQRFAGTDGIRSVGDDGSDRPDTGPSKFEGVRDFDFQYLSLNAALISAKCSRQSSGPPVDIDQNDLLHALVFGASSAMEGPSAHDHHLAGAAMLEERRMGEHLGRRSRRGW